MLRQLFRFQDKKRRMHSPDTAKKTTITRYIPAAASAAEAVAAGFEARLRLRLEQQPRVLVLAAILGQLQHRRHLVAAGSLPVALCARLLAASGGY